MKPELEVPKNTEWQEQISHINAYKLKFNASSGSMNIVELNRW